MQNDVRLLLAKQSRTHTFERIDQRRDGNLWRILHQKLHVIFLALARAQDCAEIDADAAEDLAQRTSYLAASSGAPPDIFVSRSRPR